MQKRNRVQSGQTISIIRRAEIFDSTPINVVSATLGYDAVSDDMVQQWLKGLVASDEHRVWVYEADHEVVAWLHALSPSDWHPHHSLKLQASLWTRVAAGKGLDENW